MAGGRRDWCDRACNSPGRGYLVGLAILTYHLSYKRGVGDGATIAIADTSELALGDAGQLAFCTIGNIAFQDAGEVAVDAAGGVGRNEDWCERAGSKDVSGIQLLGLAGA
ncbi:hypothetical protein BAUCODRAFT_571384 [Baudoinia panamericana UAMH 10762]|uniref:Uncharacterized protein n=1 Tax=Baudoinia panamericana (strain UAMH 10762) TaxID=717646 RepID=M2MWQ2_BAUPA|nr:uncharacterized protein BAUCODRAFT_571384 [Baudoinia panamericana UAMH 10762]EMC91014.1 hypothetical protein BAUCODRAFT_571384 [Baudoinia panamericana UAMH 10762]